MRIDGPFIDLYKNKNFFIISILLLFTVSSAIATIYSKHKIRMLHASLQRLYVERSNLNTEWSKILLEKSTWLSDCRVEKLARENLGMINPEQVYIIGQ